jgi:hypothetical protein
MASVPTTFIARIRGAPQYLNWRSVAAKYVSGRDARGNDQIPV